MDAFFGFRAVHGRIAVDFTRPLVGNVETEIAKTRLAKLGFKEEHPSPVKSARLCIGLSTYRRGARTEEAPDVFDCSSFTKWLYGQMGIWLPRRAVDQRDFGETVVWEDVHGGDLIFTPGARGRYVTDPQDDVGHVGVVTNVETVIHAANGKVGVVEDPLEEFWEDPNMQRGIRRYLTTGHEICTYSVPDGMEIEHERDVWWKILQTA